MKPLPLLRIVLLALFLAACTPTLGWTGATPSPTVTPVPTWTRSADELIDILEASDPASPLYDPSSEAYAEFTEALPQLAAINASTNSAASELAYAIQFPRPDSILAAAAVISLGPDWAGTTLPILMGNLKNPRPEVRVASAIVLSSIGDNASCSLGNIGPLLWDSDPQVRTSAALAIQGITGQELVAEEYAINPGEYPSTPVTADIPEGSIVAAARAWWTETGSKVNWHPRYDLCDP